MQTVVAGYNLVDIWSPNSFVVYFDGLRIKLACKTLYPLIDYIYIYVA